MFKHKERIGLTVDSLKATPGVVAYFGANDIPGKNKVQPYPGPTFKEELLCSGTIGYAGQPIGIIVAESSGVARSAANKVVINYTKRGAPVLDPKPPVLVSIFVYREGHLLILLR